MTARVSDWLPPGPATGPRVRDALEGGVAAWAGKWFADARLSVSAIEPRSEGAPGVANGWLLLGDTVAVPADSPEAIRLAGMALGADPENLVLSEPDRDILGRLATAILADLGTLLATALGRKVHAEDMGTATADPLGGDAGIVIHILDARARALTRAVVPLAALVPFVRAGIPARPGPALSSVVRAVERTSARIEVRLGETRLSLADLTGLAAGDVLVLDRTVQAGARVSLAAGDRTIASAAVGAHGATTLLTLAPENRDR
jgi:flagellar motor switch/type III secretory pathway protein FliN